MKNSSLQSMQNIDSHDSPLDFNSTILEEETSQPNTMPLLCSGYGAQHTDKYGKPYVQINLEGIRQLVDAPQQVGKSEAQWLIPSTLPSRTFKEQETRGEFHLLCADIDQNSNGITRIAEIIELLIPGCDYEIYTSKSAAESNQKCRIIIPLNKPLLGSDWVIFQEILNDKLLEKNIIPDRASERAAQLFYLPNQGEFYACKSKRNGTFFDAAFEWFDEITQKHEAIAQQIEELEYRRKEAQSSREAFSSCSDGNAYPSLIEAFLARYTVQEILLQAGYDQKGNTFRHPNSESGSFSASVKNNRVHSLSSNDPLYTDGGGIGAHDAFSAFIVLFHGGDSDAALKDAGDNWVMIGSESWNTVKRREFAQAREINALEKDIYLVSEDIQPIDIINDNLPPFDSCLMKLPDGLGLMQNYIYNQMIYPDLATASITAIAYFSHYAQTHAVVQSPLGKLALCEYYIVMSRTSSGKEKLRQALDNLDNQIRIERQINIGAGFQRAMPASPQGLHRLLEDNAEQTFLSDEFAEYLIQSSKNGGDTYKRAMVGYLMEIYTKSFSTVCVPNAVTSKYKPVNNPRVTIFATTTGERLSEALTASQADSGTYNRFVLFTGTQLRIAKKYEGYIFEPSADLLSFMEWLLQLPQDIPLTLDKDATDYFKRFDSENVEPLKFNDPQLAGRLSEQSLKMAGLFALGSKRTNIAKEDLELAYKIRINLYERAKAYLNSEGSLNGEDATSGAYNQLAELILKKERIPISRLPSYSRKYKALKVWERDKVLDHLARTGLAIVVCVKGGNCLVKK